MNTEVINQEGAFFTMLFEILPVGFFSTSIQTNQIIDANQVFCDMVGYTSDELKKLTWKDLTPERYIHKDIENDRKALEEGEKIFTEKHYKRKDGKEIPVHLHHTALFRPLINEHIFCSFVIDIRRMLKQQETIKKLSTPFLPIWNKILMAPLIGMFDSKRIKELTEAVLNNVMYHKPRMLLMDVSGISFIDSNILREIIHLIATIKLLGTKTIIVSIKPFLAQSFVRIGASFDGIETFATLEQGLKRAIEKESKKVF